MNASIVTALRRRFDMRHKGSTARHTPLYVGNVAVGALDDQRVAHLARWRAYLDITDTRVATRPSLADAAALTGAFDEIACDLAERGLLTRWRNERYRVAPTFDAPALCTVERAAARFFGIRTYAAHVNGVVASEVTTGAAGGASSRSTPEGLRMWIARRSHGKPIDPGLLDNLVGGGIPAGSSIRDSVIRECWEEAGIPAALAAQARPAGLISIRREVPDGLHVETLFVHDLVLPADFLPQPVDGEVIEHRLCNVDELLAIITDSRAMTYDASLVVVDYLVRHGVLAPDEPDYQALVEALHGG